jgi:nucleoside-diphosphate-sugar epimerase
MGQSMPSNDKVITALVTGGGGFLGKALCNALKERGYRVKSFSRGHYPDLDAMGVESIQGDLAHVAAVENAATGCDVIFHVAAKPGIWGSYNSYYSANVLGTKNVIHACLKHKVPYLVYTSSPSVTFSGHDQINADESESYPPKFLAHYPETKARAEQAVIAAHSSDLKTVSLRPHLIWGPGDNHIVPRILKLGSKGRIRFVGQHGKLIDTVYIDNAVDAHLLAFDRLRNTPDIVGGKRYFITNQDPWAHEAVINGILKAGGFPPVNGRVPAWLAYFGGFMLEIIYKALRFEAEPPMTRFVARQLATAHWFNPQAAQEELGYVPKVPMREGMNRLTKYLRETTK